MLAPGLVRPTIFSASHRLAIVNGSGDVVTRKDIGRDSACHIGAPRDTLQASFRITARYDPVPGSLFTESWQMR